MTKPLGYKQSLAETAFLLFAIWLPHFPSFAAAEISRVIIALLLAYLLMFLVVRSTDICRVVTICFMAFCSYADRAQNKEFRVISFASPQLQDAQSLSPQFQRPPPLLS